MNVATAVVHATGSVVSRSGDNLRLLRKAASASRRVWSVFCRDGALWEGELTHEEAELEQVAAQHVCECGGPHVLVGTNETDASKLV